MNMFYPCCVVVCAHETQAFAAALAAKVRECGASVTRGGAHAARASLSMCLQAVLSLFKNHACMEMELAQGGAMPMLLLLGNQPLDVDAALPVLAMRCLHSMSKVPAAVAVMADSNGLLLALCDGIRERAAMIVRVRPWWQ